MEVEPDDLQEPPNYKALLALSSKEEAASFLISFYFIISPIHQTFILPGTGKDTEGGKCHGKSLVESVVFKLSPEEGVESSQTQRSL